MNEQKQDVYTRITDKIIADLENGVRTWLKPWDAGNTTGRIVRPLRHNHIPYSGINVLMLWASAIDYGFTVPVWMTFKQALELNAHVRKGEKGSLVVYANTVTRTETDGDGTESEREARFLKGYTVFNVQQIDGLPDSYYAADDSRPLHTVDRLPHAEAFFAATGADIRQRGNRAFYSEDGDYIQMPPIETFRDAASFFAVLGHETCHWSKHSTRLARDFGRSKFGDEGYAREEIVAELASAFLCADLALTPEVREDHAAYIQHWIKIIKKEKGFLFQAAGHAQRAVDFLHRLQPLNYVLKSRLPSSPCW
jgi:antirestriction protein ArdC